MIVVSNRIACSRVSQSSRSFGAAAVQVKRKTAMVSTRPVIFHASPQIVSGRAFSSFSRTHPQQTRHGQHKARTHMSLMATQSAATVSQGQVIQRTKHPHMLTNLGQEWMMESVNADLPDCQVILWLRFDENGTINLGNGARTVHRKYAMELFFTIIRVDGRRCDWRWDPGSQVPSTLLL